MVEVIDIKELAGRIKPIVNRGPHTTEDEVFEAFRSLGKGDFKNADIFCLSSEFEGFGLVLVESMTFGTKIVSTKCRGGPNSVFSENKFIISDYTNCKNR